MFKYKNNIDSFWGDFYKKSKGVGQLLSFPFLPYVLIGKYAIQMFNEISSSQKKSDKEINLNVILSKVDDDEIESIAKLCEFIEGYCRSLSEFEKHPLFSKLIPVLRRNIAWDEEILAKYIEYAIIISDLSATKLESFLGYFIDYLIGRKSNESEKAVFTDFIVLCFKYFNHDWNNYFDYEEESYGFYNIKINKATNIEKVRNDNVWIIPLVNLSLENKIEPLVVDLLQVHRKGNNIPSYEYIYNQMNNFCTCKNGALDFIVEINDDYELICMGVAYLKFKGNKSISDMALMDLLPKHYISLYRDLWWKCQLWSEYKSKLNLSHNDYRNYLWLDEKKLGLGWHLEKYRKKLVLQGKSTFELTPEASYLYIDSNDQHQSMLEEKYIKSENGEMVQEIALAPIAEEKDQVPNSDRVNILMSQKTPSNKTERNEGDLVKRGKPTYPLEHYFYPNDKLGEEETKQLIDELKRLTIGRVGVQFAQLIVAAVKNRIFVNKPPKSAFINCGFHDFGRNNAFASAYNARKLTYDTDLKSNDFCQLCHEQMKSLAEKYGFNSN